jgi:hypothetical protein
MTKQTLDVLGLSPNQNYIIKVFATKTDLATGNVTVSNYSPILQISTPSLSGSGANFTTTNYGTDIQLSGGSLFAGTFPSNIGQVDLTTTNPNGTGVIVNQTGVGAYSGGVQEFFLNAKTGAATFAGTITTPTIQSANYSASIASVEPKFSVAGTQISLTDGSISAPQFRITPSGTAYFGGDVSGSAYAGISLGAYISNTAQTAANGKNVIHYSTSAPGTTSNIVGDIWYQYGTSAPYIGQVIAQWVGAGGTSWTSVTVSGLVIGNIDAGSITTGTLSAGILIKGPKFQTSNYGLSGYGIQINSGSSADSITFSYGSTNIGNITSYYASSSVNGIIINAGPTPDVLASGNNPAIIVDTVGINLYGNPGAIGTSPFIYLDKTSGISLYAGSGGLIKLESPLDPAYTSYNSITAKNIVAQSGSNTYSASGNNGLIVLVY